MKKILVAGSLSFDVIFGIHGNIKQEIPLRDGEINNINLMFTAKEKQEYLGGTAGNICYGLGLLGESPLLFSLVGKDFDDDYQGHLMKLGINVRAIKKNDEFSAIFYGISDEAKEQIGIWQPNAYGKYIDAASLNATITAAEIKEVAVAIFSPGTGVSTLNQMQEFRELNQEATVIFDPSQVLSIFYDKERLLACLKLCDIFIGNETEVAQLQTVFGMSVADVLAKGVKTVIETLGADGVNIHQLVAGKPQVTFVAPIPAAKFVEATGAGDSFRSGLIYGLVQGKSLADSCRIGAYMGSQSVGEYGGQLYKIDKSKVAAL